MAERTVIYYYSGTGNSLSMARQVAGHLGQTDLISVYRLRDDAKVPEKYDRVGICAPTCFIQAPRIVREVCEKLEILRSQKVFILATCGASDGFLRIDCLPGEGQVRAEPGSGSRDCVPCGFSGQIPEPSESL